MGIQAKHKWRNKPVSLLPLHILNSFHFVLCLILIFNLKIYLNLPIIHLHAYSFWTVSNTTKHKQIFTAWLFCASWSPNCTQTKLFDMCSMAPEIISQFSASTCRYLSLWRAAPNHWFKLHHFSIPTPIRTPNEPNRYHCLHSFPWKP